MADTITTKKERGEQPLTKADIETFLLGVPDAAELDITVGDRDRGDHNWFITARWNS